VYYSLILGIIRAVEEIGIKSVWLVSIGLNRKQAFICSDILKIK
jgi:hypothetical protein